MTDWEAEETKIGKLSKAVGGSMTPERRNEVYFGHPPKGTYFGAPKDISRMHDLWMSEDTKKRLYGIGGGREQDVGDVVESRLGTDSKSGLIREMVENSNLTRTEAEMLVSRWMQVNDLTEVEDEVLGRIIVPRGRQ